MKGDCVPMRFVLPVAFAAVVMVAAPAHAALFNLRCAIEGQEFEIEFLFNTNDDEVLQRRVGAQVQLAKYQTLEMTYAEVVFGKFALMGKPKQRYKAKRQGGPIFESIRKGSKWSDWKEVGTCRIP